MFTFLSTYTLNTITTFKPTWSLEFSETQKFANKFVRVCSENNGGSSGNHTLSEINITAGQFILVKSTQ